MEKVIFPDAGGGGVSQKVIFLAWRGGEGGSKPSLKKMKYFINSSILAHESIALHCFGLKASLDFGVKTTTLVTLYAKR